MKVIQLNNGKGINLYDQGEFVSDYISNSHDYFEREELDVFKGLFPKHGTIIEIGANIGNHVHYYENYLDYDRIVAFEPIKWNADILRLNVTSEVIQCGLWNEETTATFKVYQDNMGACQIGETGSGDIQLKTLDSFGFSDVSFIKIDVEGAELNVLKGAAKTILMNKPVLWIEINHTVSYIKVKEYLAGLGYSAIIQLGDQPNFIFSYDKTI